jgi:LPXTG-site transpeptidase (sortase) family protein
MSEKPLLLHSAKMGVVFEESKTHPYVAWLLTAAGIFVVLVGLTNVVVRFSAQLHAQDDIVQTAFAPLGSLSLQQTVASTTPLTPARLSIPSIGVRADVEQVGKKPDGSMATPSSFETVGWYKLGARPGQEGNAVIAGHVNNALTKAGVFEHLSDVVVGDTISVSDTSGRTLTYVVTQTAQYKTDEAPTDIFTATGPTQLVLITCDGQWDADAHSYDKRFVVYAELTNR